MSTRNVIGPKYEVSECRKHGWSPQRVPNQAKFRLRDAIAVRFNPKNIDKYEIQRKPFVVKCDAVDVEGTPIEIKRHQIVDDGGGRLAIPFSEYLSIKTYRDVYKLICERFKIPYTYYAFNKSTQTEGKRKRITFDELYAQYPEIIPLDSLKNYGLKRKQSYYHTLMNFCYENGVTEMFNSFVTSDTVHDIFNSWVQNFKRKDFYLDCQSGIYHSSDLSFYVKPVRSYWGFDRMTVFVRLKKNV